MTSDFIKAVSFRIVATASALVCGLASLKLYSHYLDPEAYGFVLIALQILSYLPLMDGGFRTTTNREILSHPSPELRKATIDFSQKLYSYINILVMVVAWLAMGCYFISRLGRNSGQSLSFYLAIGTTTGLSFIANAQASLLIGLKLQSSGFLLNALSAWLNVIALWVALRSGTGVWAFPISSACATAIIWPLSVRLIKAVVPQLKLLDFKVDDGFRDNFRRLRQAAWACFRSQVSIMLLFTLDVILAGIICGAKEAAIYGVLSRFFGIVRNFLQATGEAAWPIIAERRKAQKEITGPILRVNAWLYGSVMGAVCATLLPFIHWYMGGQWIAPWQVIQLVALRFLITGVSSPAAYFLIGTGHFKLIARYIEREVVAACILGTAGGFWLGLPGLAAGFAAATICGTFFPIFRAYTHMQAAHTVPIFWEAWWRALLAFGVSYVSSTLLVQLIKLNVLLIAVGGVAVMASLCLGICIAVARLKLGGGDHQGPITAKLLLINI